jgi:hypothetical protein
MGEWRIHRNCKTCKYARVEMATYFCKLDKCTKAWNAANKDCKKWEVND